jgi:hypothetical protein
MELRHYKETVECLDECEAICGDKIPDIFLRRSQARAYNKSANNEELGKAILDIEKAINLKNENIYLEHKSIVEAILTKKTEADKERIRSKKTR